MKADACDDFGSIRPLAAPDHPWRPVNPVVVVVAESVKTWSSLPRFTPWLANGFVQARERGVESADIIPQPWPRVETGERPRKGNFPSLSYFIRDGGKEFRVH